MRRGRRAAALRLPVAACAAALLAGCGLLAPAEPPLVAALIDQLPADLPRQPRASPTLLVLPPQARAAYDTRQMAYALRPHHIAYYSRHEWGERPTQMLHPLLVRALESTGGFAAVLTPPLAGDSGYELHTELLELVQDFGAQPPVLRLALRVQLHEARGRRAVATREFVVREPLRERSPEAGVAAANAATAQALRAIAAFVLERTG